MKYQRTSETFFPNSNLNFKLTGKLAHSNSSSKTFFNKNMNDGSYYSRTILQDNTDIDLRKSEKDMKQLISSKKNARKLMLSQMHSNIMRESLDMKLGSVYLTGGNDLKKTKPKVQEETLETEILTKTDNNFNTVQTMTAFNKKPLPLPDYFTQANSSRTREISTDSIMKLSTNNRSLHKYLTDVKNITKLNYLNNYKEEQALKYNENYDNEIGEQIENIASAEDNRQLLLETQQKFTKYLNFLYKLKDNEKDKLEKYIYEQHSLYSQIKKSMTEISKLKAVYDKQIELFKFLVCVRERRATLPAHFTSKLELVDDNPIIKTKPSKERKTNSTINKLLYFKIQSTISNKYETSPKKNVSIKDDFEILRFEKYLTQKVYDTPDEFVLDYNSIENNFFKLLETYEENNIKIKILNDETKNLLISLKDKNKIYDYKIVEEQEYVTQLIKRNKSLNEELSALQNPKSNNKETTNSLYSHINFLYKNIKKLVPENFYEAKPISNFKAATQDINYIYLAKVKELEIVVIKLLNKYNSYKTNKETIKTLAEIESSMEKKRKILKNKEMLERDLERRRLQRLTIISKINNFTLKSKRKVSFKFKHNSIVKKENKNNKNISEFDNFISYGD